MKNPFLIFWVSVCLLGISFAKDTDGDGLSDEAEGKIGTSANSKDTDNDGSSDYDEVMFESSPTNPNQKIVKISDWKKVDEKSISLIREAVVSHDGKLVNKKVTSGTLNSSPELSEYFLGLANAKKQELANKSSYKPENSISNWYNEREKYLKMSSKFEEIKKLREENSALRSAYLKNQTNENLEAWNKVRLPLIELEKSEYEKVKARLAAPSFYKPKNRLEELEDRVEELEDELQKSR